MSDLAQVVCTQDDGECAVALTPFVPIAEVRAALSDFQADGYGERKKSRPKLEVRNQSGAVLDVSAKAGKQSQKNED